MIGDALDETNFSHKLLTSHQKTWDVLQGIRSLCV